MESMMTARQVAELLGVHENWVYDQAASGELPSYKLGGTRRFDPGELRGWITEHREAERERPAKRERQTKKRRPPKATRRPDDGQPRLFE
jgi:excisionase family DNA binding protein